MIPQHLQAEAMAAALALWRTPGIGPSGFQTLQAHFPDLRELYTQKRASLQALHLKPALHVAMNPPDWSAVERDLDWAKAPHRHLLYNTEASYPSLLREISAPPPLLFVEGNLHLLHQNAVAIVGSRNPTASGREAAYAFARDLAANGWLVSSGLALGIDYEAHRGALVGSGSTVAVLGTGLDQIYPARHRELAQQIAASGALVSEFPLGVKPEARNFPRRNRILSGLSIGVLVVEAALKSGSLITARYANEQGRDVFAIPGSIHNPLSKGCHYLLRSGAILVETSSEVHEELRGSGLAQRCAPFQPTPAALSLESGIALASDEQLLIQSLAHDPTSIEILVNRTGFSVAKLSALLARLELAGRVETRAGAYCLHRGRND